MGLGDDLTWTSLARDATKKYGVEKVRIFQIKKNNKYIQYGTSDIFNNNPYIYQDKETPDPTKVHDIYFGIGKKPDRTPSFHYMISSPRTNKTRSWKFADNYTHIIHQYSKYLDIENPSLQCELYFSPEEEKKVNDWLAENIKNEPFIVIAAQGKRTCKEIPLKKYQEIANHFDSKIKVVQVGTNKAQRLKNVIDMCGKFSFRESAYLIKHAKMVITGEGGVGHASNAVDTKAIVIYTGFLHPNISGYPKNINLNLSKHGTCNYEDCKVCIQEKNNLDTGEIISLIEDELGLF